jgi:LacI family transcriptional regulator
MFEPDLPGLRCRGIVGGVRRFAEEAGDWWWTLDPYALRAPTGRYDGLILHGPLFGFGDERGRGRRRLFRGAPVVSVDWSHSHVRMHRARENRYTGARLAARHLEERGYRQFACLSFANEQRGVQERHWFNRELSVRGKVAEDHRVDPRFAQHAKSWTQAVRALRGWVSSLAPPVGIYAASPALARLAAEAAERAGLHVPEELGIVAGDDDPVLCEAPPGLSSLHFDYPEVGYRAARLLDRLMRSEHRAPSAPLVEPALVPRRSTDRLGVDDPLVARALWLIDDRRTEGITPRSVAELLGLSQRGLSERFRKAGRATPEHEIARARIKHAKLLLVEGQATMRMTAWESGFGSYGAMLRAFHRHEGTTPSAWRREELRRRQGGEEVERRPTRMPTIHRGARRWVRGRRRRGGQDG